MHKTYALLFSTAMLLANCGENSSKNNIVTESSENNTAVAENVETPAAISQGKNSPSDASIIMLGAWVGEMSGKKLNIVIETVGDSTISGYNTLGATRRPIAGNYMAGSWDIPCAKAFEATLNEPGDDKNDGVFSIKFVGYEDVDELDGGPECKGNLKGAEAVGTWTSNASKKAKDIALTKQK